MLSHLFTFLSILGALGVFSVFLLFVWFVAYSLVLKHIPIFRELFGFRRHGVKGDGRGGSVLGFGSDANNQIQNQDSSQSQRTLNLRSRAVRVSDSSESSLKTNKVTGSGVKSVRFNETIQEFSPSPQSFSPVESLVDDEEEIEIS